MSDTSSPAPTIKGRQSGDVRGLVPPLDGIVSAAQELREAIVRLAGSCRPHEFRYEANALMTEFEQKIDGLDENLQAEVEKTSAKLIKHET